MLRYLGEKDSANNLESAIAGVIAEGKNVTYDLKLDPATAVGTSQVADAVIAQLKPWAELGDYGEISYCKGRMGSTTVADGKSDWGNSQFTYTSTKRKPELLKQSYRFLVWDL